MSLLPSAAGLLLCTAGGLWYKRKQQKRERILKAAQQTAEEILFLLQCGCYSTLEILQALLPVEELPCIRTTLLAVQDGADLHQAWETECQLFCQKQHLNTQDAACIRQLVTLLGSMELTEQCAALEALQKRLQEKSALAAQKNKVDGNAAVKIGLLCGMGIGLLLWHP
jgi:hypothetical protein